MTNTKKRYRVTQYEQMSDFVVASLRIPTSQNRPVRVTDRDYRWLWVAKIVAWLHKGRSVGAGIRLYTTKITKLL